MVKYVYVHPPQTIDGKRTQEIDVVYDLVSEGLYKKPEIEKFIYPNLLSNSNMEHLFYFLFLY